MLAPYQPDALRGRWARTITYASGPYRDAAANGCAIHSLAALGCPFFRTHESNPEIQRTLTLWPRSTELGRRKESLRASVR
jgi:hypothetical protein